MAGSKAGPLKSAAKLPNLAYRDGKLPAKDYVEVLNSAKQKGSAAWWTSFTVLLTGDLVQLKCTICGEELDATYTSVNARRHLKKHALLEPRAAVEPSGTTAATAAISATPPRTGGIISTAAAAVASASPLCIGTTQTSERDSGLADQRGNTITAEIAIAAAGDPAFATGCTVVPTSCHHIEQAAGSGSGEGPLTPGEQQQAEPSLFARTVLNFGQAPDGCEQQGRCFFCKACFGSQEEAFKHALTDHKDAWNSLEHMGTLFTTSLEEGPVVGKASASGGKGVKQQPAQSSSSSRKCPVCPASCGLQQLADHVLQKHGAQVAQLASRIPELARNAVHVTKYYVDCPLRGDKCNKRMIPSWVEKHLWDKHSLYLLKEVEAKDGAKVCLCGRGIAKCPAVLLSTADCPAWKTMNFLQAEAEELLRNTSNSHLLSGMKGAVDDLMREYGIPLPPAPDASKQRQHKVVPYTAVPSNDGQGLTEEDAGRIRIASFNLQDFGYMDYMDSKETEVGAAAKMDLQRQKLYGLAFTIYRSKADLVAFQEIDDPAAAEQLRRQLSVLSVKEEFGAEGFEWKVQVSEPLNFPPPIGESDKPFPEYAAFLWKEPKSKDQAGIRAWSEHEESFFTLDTELASNEIRPFMRSPFYALMQYRGRPVLFINCHLASKVNAPEKEVMRIPDLVAAARNNQSGFFHLNMAVIVLGDFNADPEELLYTSAWQVGRDCGDGSYLEPMLTGIKTNAAGTKEYDNIYILQVKEGNVIEKAKDGSAGVLLELRPPEAANTLAGDPLEGSAESAGEATSTTRCGPSSLFGTQRALGHNPQSGSPILVRCPTSSSRSEVFAAVGGTDQNSDAQVETCNGAAAASDSSTAQSGAKQQPAVSGNKRGPRKPYSNHNLVYADVRIHSLPEAVFQRPKL